MRALFIVILVLIINLNLAYATEVGFTLTLPNGVSQSEGASQKFLAHEYSAADRNTYRG